MIRLALASVTIVIVASVPLSAAIIIVNSTADVIADDGACTLREAIISANEDASSGGMAGECPAGSGNDIINLGAGTFTLTIPGVGEDFSATGDLDVRDNLVLQGVDSSPTIIDAKGTDRVFEIYSWASIFRVTIKGGTTSSDGGGIHQSSGTQLYLTSCLIEENSASSGGGIESEGDLFIQYSTVRANSASGFGGGITQSLGTLTLSHSTVAGNTSGDDGGGIVGGNLIVDASTISSNSSDASGGGLAVGGSLQLFNSTVSGNAADLDGGGIYTPGSASATNSTIADNTAGVAGEAVTHFNSLTIVNTILSGDCDARFGSLTISGGGNLESPDSTCNLTQTSDQSNVSAEALNLGPLQDNGGPTLTHSPIPPSAAIDTGVNLACLAEDQREAPRPQDGDLGGIATCDVGSVEIQPCPSPQVVTLEDQTIDTIKTVLSCSEIRLGPNLWVDAPADLTLKARTRVVFRDGVSIGDGASCKVIIDPLLVIPPGIPVADFTFTSSGLTVTFANRSTGDPPLAYVWEFGDQTPISTAENPQHTYGAAGTYEVRLTASNSFGTDSIVAAVTVFP